MIRALGCRIGMIYVLAAQGLLSLVLGTCAFAQITRPADTPNPSLFQLLHTSWTERDGAPPRISGIAQAPDGSLWLGSGEGLYHFDGFTFKRVTSIDRGSPAPTEIDSLLGTSNGDLWIGTTLDGVILLRNGEVSRFPKFEDFLSIRLYSAWKAIWMAQFGSAQHWDSSASMAHDGETSGKSGESRRWCDFRCISTRTELSGLTPLSMVSSA
jgi:hypothetical protein